MNEISYCDLINLKYPEITKVGVLCDGGTKLSYHETFYKQNTNCHDIQSYFLFETRELLFDWL